jgi:hypothetical protein
MCKSSFTETFNFFRHVKAFHYNDGSCLNVGLLPQIDATAILHDCVTTSGILHPITNTSSLDKLECLKSEGAALVSSLRANSSIPYSVIPHIMESFNVVSKSLVKTCQAEAVECLSAVCEGNGELLQSFEKRLTQRLDEFKEPFGYLSTKYKQDVFFNGHEAFVSPKSFNLGLRFETKCGVTKTVYDSFQYVSVKDTLLVLLRNEQYVRGLLQMQMTESSPEVIAHCSHAELMRNRLAF